MAKQLTVAEVATELGLKPVTVRKQLAKGKLRGVKIGRDWLIEQKDVVRYRHDHLGRPGREEGPQGPRGHVHRFRTVPATIHEDGVAGVYTCRCGAVREDAR